MKARARGSVSERGLQPSSGRHASVRTGHEGSPESVRLLQGRDAGRASAGDAARDRSRAQTRAADGQHGPDDVRSDARPAAVVVGVVARPWGYKGQFLVNPHGTDTDFLLARKRLRLRQPGKSEEREYPILSAHFAGGRLVVLVEGCDSSEQARRLRGAEVVMSSEEFARAPEGTFYPHELAGLSVVKQDGEAVGIVERLLDTGGGEILLVRSGAGRDLLIPFVDSICRVDRAAGRIEIDPPEGLMELD